MRVYILNETRANSFDEDSFDTILELWEKSYSKSQEFDDCIKYGIYHEYESDYKGDYTLSIATEEIESDKEFEILETDKFKVYKIESVDDLPTLWQDIWDEEENEKFKRTYTYDLEKYNLDGSVEVYVNIK